VGRGDDIPAEQVTQLPNEPRKRQARVDIGDRFAESGRHRVHRVRRIAGDKRLVRLRLLKRVHTLTLEILDELCFTGVLVVHCDHPGRYRCEPGALRGAETTRAGNQCIPRPDGTYKNGLGDAPPECWR
jgi:hypothetical protein